MMRARILPLNYWRKAKNQRFLCVLLERIKEKEKENPPRSSSKMPKIPSLFFFFFFFLFWGSGAIYSGFVIVQLSEAPKGLLASFEGPLGCARADVDISSLSFSLVQLQTHILMPFWTPIKLILVSLERSRCLVSRTLNQMKFQQLEQNLWSREVS